MIDEYLRCSYKGHYYRDGQLVPRYKAIDNIYNDSTLNLGTLIVLKSKAKFKK